MIKILQVQGGMHKAGTEAVIMGWYRNINTQDIQFDFTNMSGKECEYDKEIINRGGKIINIPSRSDVGNIKHLYYLYKAIKENGPYTAVHSHMNFHGGAVALISKIAGVKNIIVHAHNTMDEGLGIKRKIEIFILRNLILNLSNYFTACGQEAGKFLFGNKRDFIVINNSVDIKKFKPDNSENISKIKKQYGIGNELILGHIGRFSEQKNHKFIIPIMKELRNRNINFKFILIGDGELKNEFFKLIEEENLQQYILYLGLQDNINEWLNVMDIFIFPSLYEGLPVVLVEAQAVGLRCIISDKISNEVDLGLDLIRYLGIDNSNLWVDEILNYKNNKIYDPLIIEEKMKEKGYILESNTEKIINIYTNKYLK